MHPDFWKILRIHGVTTVLVKVCAQLIVDIACILVQMYTYSTVIVDIAWFEKINCYVVPSMYSETVGVTEVTLGATFWLSKISKISISKIFRKNIFITQLFEIYFTSQKYFFIFDFFERSGYLRNVHFYYRKFFLPAGKVCGFFLKH